MNIYLLPEARSDLIRGYWFYENQEAGLGEYFRSSVSADIESLRIHGGIHQTDRGVGRKLCKSFPYSVYYVMTSNDAVAVVAILDQRQNPDKIDDRLKGFRG